MTMVERASAAYWNAGHTVGRWDDQQEDQKQVVRQRMRAAITAMREPTESMTEAARGQMPVQYHYRPDNGVIRADIIWPGDKRYVSPVGVYQAAIDAALAETE